MKHGICIRGVGSYLPNKIITNQDIESVVDDTSAEWIFEKLGIEERRVVENETVADMGYYASIKALNDAGIDKEELDMIIVATSSPEYIAPSISCTIHNKLNIQKDVPAFDINAVCAGYVYAMSMACTLISNNVYKNILVVASEAYSKNTNWNDRHCVFFGDGAGALVMGKSDIGWATFELSANGSGTGMTGFRCDPPNPFVQLGKQVWDKATTVLPTSLKNIIFNTKIPKDDIKMIVPHQPSINILKLISEKTDIPFSKVKTVMGKYANIACASVPIALDDAIRLKEIESGDLIAITAIGSGWAWGSMIIKYERT
jgi:3-oxoacyl-[acyl-carrier-protein] synthase-3